MGARIFPAVPDMAEGVTAAADPGPDSDRNPDPVASAAGAIPAPDSVPLHRSVRTRVALWGAVLNATLVLLVAAASFLIAQRIIVGNAENRTRQQTLQQAERIGATLHSVAISARTVEQLVLDSGGDRERLLAGLHAVVDADPAASGGLVALEPDVAGPGPFAYYAGDQHRDRDLVAAQYAYRNQAWYRRTRDGAGPWWSDPYFNDTAGGVWMVTYNQPLRGAQGERLGMISLDVPVAHFAGLMTSVLNRDGLRAVLVAPGGTIAVHPGKNLALRTRLDQQIARGREDLAPLAEARRQGRRLEFDHVDQALGERRFTVFTPIQDTGWSLHLSLSHWTVLADLYRATRWLLVCALLALLLCAWAQLRMADRLTRPLEQLTDSAQHFSQGEYDRAVPHVEREDEVGVMARAMDGARTSIKGQLAQIERMGAARQKLESELAIARDIQLAMLPVAPTLRSHGHALRVYAALEPAKAVGGDFYSFSVRGKQWLWFAIGDVSDKGVPAALFMARAMTVLEVAAGLGGSPGDALRTASRRLVGGNDTCMFATVLCGVLDVATGELDLASAGHEPAVLLHADGRAEFLAVESGPALGFEVSDAYPVWHGQLQPGDTLVAYTDGITEAFNAAQEAFGSERLLAALIPGCDPQRACHVLVEAVHRFCAGAPQSDDITVLALCLQAQAQAQAPGDG